MRNLVKEGVKVDQIITDPPYQTTKCKWDSIIPFDEMWECLEALIKDDGAIVMTAQQPFTSALVMSNPKLFRYSLVYEKTSPTGHLNAKKMPLRYHEDILVFYKKLPTYNPQMTTGHERKVSSAKSRIASVNRNIDSDTVYGARNPDKIVSYDSTERYPKSIITFPSDKQKSRLHPTQKPVALMEYLIKTYTNEGDIVLDFTMGSGTTGVQANQLNRRFIDIELDEGYFKVACDRINNTEWGTSLKNTEDIENLEDSKDSKGSDDTEFEIGEW